ncbi:phage tail protein [Oleidesulfovibrio sp.]|uniref:phage tail-collar fiber domain-containing protein n=1 Tax=Oleidesulfovibrio sp. TaxID=2909707 RepID=UPI003A8A11EE
MATAITLAGESLIARKQAAGEPLVIDTFLLALVPDLNPDLPVDRTEGKPDAGQMMHTYAIPEEFKGYVNPNQVV